MSSFNRHPHLHRIPDRPAFSCAVGLGGFIAAIGLGNGHAAWAAIQAHGVLLVGMGLVVTLVPLIVATLFAVTCFG